MADDDVPEGTPDIPADADDGDGAADVANPSTSPEPMEEAVEEAVDVAEPLSPYRAAKMAGIVVGAVLLCAVVVVAAVWAITAIVEEDEDESWIEYVSPSALAADFDDDYDEYRRGYGKGPSASHEQWIWPDKHHSDSGGFATKDGACGMPCGSRARTGPVVVVVLGSGGLGSGGGLGDWGYAEGFGFGGGGAGSRGLLPDILPFSDDPSLLMDFFGASGLELPELQDELSLEATELDNEAPPAVEGLTPT